MKERKTEFGKYRVEIPAGGKTQAARHFPVSNYLFWIQGPRDFSDAMILYRLAFCERNVTSWNVSSGLTLWASLVLLAFVALLHFGVWRSKFASSDSCLLSVAQWRHPVFVSESDFSPISTQIQDLGKKKKLVPFCLSSYCATCGGGLHIVRPPDPGPPELDTPSLDPNALAVFTLSPRILIKEKVRLGRES